MKFIILGSYAGGLNSKYDLTYECENDVILSNILFGGEQ